MVCLKVLQQNWPEKTQKTDEISCQDRHKKPEAPYFRHYVAALGKLTRN